MIKAEDLRIGDIVKVSSDNCMIPKGAVCEVVAIDSERECEDKKELAGLLQIVREEWDFSHGVWCDGIEGIPITPEILEKNGWDKHIYYVPLQKSVRERYEYTLSGTDLIIDYRPYIAMNSEKFSMICGCFMLKYIQYVHEIQHILWALGENAKLNI